MSTLLFWDWTCQYLNGMFVTYNCFAFLFDKVLLEHCQYGSGMFTPHKSITSNSASLWAIFPLIALTNLWILGNNCQYRKHNINWHSWWFYVLWHLVYGVLLIIFLIFHLISGKIERFGPCLLTSQKNRENFTTNIYQTHLRLHSICFSPLIFHFSNRSSLKIRM